MTKPEWKVSVYAVAGVLPDHAVPEALDVAFDHAANDVDFAPWLDRLDCASQRLLGALGEQPAGVVDFAAEEGCAVIPVYATDKGRDVDLDDVTVHERTGIGDAVADDLIDRGAARLGKSAIAKRRRIRAMLDQELMHHLIKIIGRDARLDDRGSGMHCLGGEPTCDSHPLDSF